MTQEKHFVDFYSPGTFVSEVSRRPIESWDTAAAVEMSNGIHERYNAKPYGFKFVTLLCAEPIPDGRGGTLDVQPKELRVSGMHWLGGRVLKYDELPDDSQGSILRSNMRGNTEPVVIENTNSYRFTYWFREGDCVVDADGSIVRAGDDDDLMEYRAAWKSQTT